MKYQILGTLGILASVGAASVSANVPDANYFQVDRIELEEITDFENVVGLDAMSVMNPSRSWRADDLIEPRRRSSTSGTNPSPTVGTPGDPLVIIDQIVAIGEKIWKIIEKNKPVVDLSSQSLAALPEGVKHWAQLENWSMPETRVYRMSYKNVYGMTVIDFSFRVAYTHGGSMDGKGKYLSNIEIEPRALDVAWGYKFSAGGQVLNVHNAGTKAKPLAAVELKMNWQIDTVMKHSTESNRFYLRGDGLFKNLSDGTLPAL